MKKKSIRQKTGIFLLVIVMLMVAIPINTRADATVYITATGKKYHAYTGCRGLNRARSVTPIALSEAQRRGYTACAICEGGIAYTSSGSSSSSSNRSISSTSTAYSAASSSNVIRLAKKNVGMFIGDSTNIGLQNDSNQSIKWSVSDSSVIKIIGKGNTNAKIHAIGIGIA